MAKGPENTFIAGVHKTLAVGVYAMKNHNEYNGGIADCWYSGKARNSRDLWIEWKFISMPKRPTTVIDLVGGKDPTISHLQQDWLTSRQDEGRNVWVGIGSEDGGVLFKHDTEWRVPFTALTFKAGLIPRRELAIAISHFCLGEPQ